VKFKSPLTVNVLSPLALKRPVEFVDAVQVFCDSLPQMLPEKWGWSEPLNREFDSRNLHMLVPEGSVCETVYWKRGKRPKAEGAFTTRWISKSPKVLDTHSNIGFTVELEQVAQEALIAYLKRTSVRLKADLAFLDTLTDADREFAVESGSAPYGERFMVATHLLRHWFPDIFWATVLGPPYVRLFGKERLLSAPASVVEELGPETVYLQVSESITDVVEDPEGIRSRRELIKAHLGRNAFFVSGRGYDRLQRGAVGDVFTVPQFHLIPD
jgi:hypothetical protein